MTKRIIILVLVLLLTLTSCAANTSGGENGKTDSEKTTDTPKTSETEVDDPDDTGSVEPDVETTEKTEPQLPSDSQTEIEPNQSHVGKWRHLFAHEGKTYEDSDITLTIQAVDSETIIFSYTEYKGLELETVAVKKDGKYVFAKDISPYFEFYHYDYGKHEGCNNITGYFEFYADCISYTMTGPTNRTSSTKYTEKHETGTSPRELPDDAAKVIDGVIGTLEEKGWEGIKRIKTEPDSLKRWNVKIDPYDPEYKTVIYNLLGSYNGVDVVVRIVFNDQTQKWEPVEVYYANQHGTLLKGDTLKAFRDHTGKTDFILPADDSDLSEYFRDTPKGVTPDASYVGTWLSQNSTYWANVTSVESDRITVNFGSAKAFGLEAVALERDGKYYFSKELSPHFHWSPYSTVFRPYEDLINGYIEFFDDYFIVTAEKLFICTEGDVVTVKFLKQAENPDTSSSSVEPVEPSSKEVIPDESYVGEWVNYPYVGNGTIHILSVSSKSVTFSLGITKGPAVDGTAIMQDGKYVFGEDISPDLHYSLYDWSYKDSTTVSGYLIFKENGVCILFDEYIENSAGLGCNIKYDSYKKREDSVTKIKTELEDNGWSDFQIYSWDLNKDSDWLDKEGNEWCENVEPYSSKDVLITLVVGTTGDVLSAVRIVYDQESDDWNAVDVYYVNLSGKVLQGEELVQFMEDHGKTGMILPADDSDLLEYFS